MWCAPPRKRDALRFLAAAYAAELRPHLPLIGALLVGLVFGWLLRG